MSTASDIESFISGAAPYATVFANLFKMGDDIFLALNTPQMLALRQSAAIQAELAKMDQDLKTAQATGDLTKLNEDDSG